MTTIFDTSSGNISQGASVAENFAQGGVPAQSMNAYINPYRKMVLNDTLSRMGDNFQTRLGSIGDQAISNGAFGGSRHGLVESQAYDDYLRNVGEVSNQSNQQGFDTALGAGFKDAGMQQRAGQDLYSMGLGGYDLGRSLMQDEAAQGLQQQQLNQNILGQSASWLDQYLNRPATSTGQMSSILSGSPLLGNQTSTTKPGLFDYAGLALQSSFGGGK